MEETPTYATKAAQVTVTEWPVTWQRLPKGSLSRQEHVTTREMKQCILQNENRNKTATDELNSRKHADVLKMSKTGVQRDFVFQYMPLESLHFFFFFFFFVGNGKSTTVLYTQPAHVLRDTDAPSQSVIRS